MGTRAIMDHRIMTHTMDMVATIQNTMDMDMDIAARDMAITERDMVCITAVKDMVCITASHMGRIMDIRNTAAIFCEWQELKWPWL